MGPFRLVRRNLVKVAFVVAPLVAVAAGAQPTGYYDSVDTSSASLLRVTLHDVIDDHTRFPYTSGSTDTWDILNLADEDPNDTGRVVDVYRNTSYAKISGGTGAYNREHSWPKSYGFPSDGSTNYPYTDCHHLFVSDSGYNSSRSNKPFRNCHAGCSEKTTELTDGRGGGSGTYSGNSNWTEGSFSQGTWETWGGRKGDVARAILYMDVRYEGGVHNVTGVTEPDLIVTDDESLIDASNTGSNESVAYMGMLSVLLDWHQNDPVDSREIWRNEVVYTYQGNRNPFIDHPEWVDCVYLSQCSFDSTPPAAPVGLGAVAGDGVVDLDWTANGEGDLDGYNVYRSTTAGGGYSQINGALLAAPTYSDGSVSNGTTYFYVVTAVDASGNESGASAEVTATPAGAPDTTPPAAPSGLSANGGDGNVVLDWLDNGEGDLAGYSVFRSTTSGGPYTEITTGLLASSDYQDGSVTNGTTYFYVVTASDASGNESADSAEVDATPDAGGVPQLLLTEVFYDGSGSDDGFEWVEIYNAGATAVDLSGYSLGGGGTSYTYTLVQLSGSIAPGSTFVVGGPTSDPSNGGPSFDLVANFSPDLQNSGTTADGVALFDLPAASVDGSSVPIDAVIYGGANNSGLIDESGSANAPEVGDAPSGSSIERVDLAGSWQIQSTPAPNGVSFGGTGQTEVTLSSRADEDGWLRESSENSGVGGRAEEGSTSSSALRVGDHKKDRQYMALVSFDTSAIPDGATIVSATLRLKRGTLSGTNPFTTHGVAYADVRSDAFGGDPALVKSDFEAAATVVGAAVMSNPTANGSWSEGVLSSSGLAAVDVTGTTQFRVYLSVDDNDDEGNDYVGFYSGDHASTDNHPQLVVVYE